jgi:hypothetical protein
MLVRNFRRVRNSIETSQLFVNSSRFCLMPAELLCGVSFGACADVAMAHTYERIFLK